MCSCEAKEGAGHSRPVPLRMWLGQEGPGVTGGAGHAVIAVSVSSHVGNRSLWAHQLMLDHIKQIL